mmetsp:Transcript_21415/g.29142  ORF Transcript_21415/g.29142 Transcript_21415/m.29142 type:complete len:96 (+) Transcript_21415:463-750(+)
MRGVSRWTGRRSVYSEGMFTWNSLKVCLRLMKSTWKCLKRECTVLRKKLEMVLCKGYGSIFMEISNIFGDFADVEEHDAWKRWMSSDECFEAMTV